MNRNHPIAQYADTFTSLSCIEGITHHITIPLVSHDSNCQCISLPTILLITLPLGLLPANSYFSETYELGSLF